MADISPPGPAPAPAATSSPVQLLLHGGEDRTLGGPSVRVPRSAEALRQIGQPARAALYQGPAQIAEETVHLFNVWPPESALAALRQLKAAGKRVVFSPIYLDFSEMPLWEPLQQPDLPPQTRAALRHQLRTRGHHHEIAPGYHAMVREMLALCDHVIFLSEAERAALAAIGAEVPPERASLVHNPVDAALWWGGDPALFRQAHLSPENGPGAGDYVICIGRVEPRKNQLSLARALRDLPLDLVLVGHDGDPGYAARIRAELGERLIRPGRLEPGGEMLRSALAGARAFVLPSWAEGASLAALEAAAAGVPLVLSERSSEREYFGDLARYCDPGAPESLRAALAATLADPEAGPRADALRTHVARHMSWEGYARATAVAYQRALQSPPKAPPPELTDHPLPPLLAGEIAQAGTEASLQKIRFGAGWQAPEEGLRRTSAPRAELWLRGDRALRPRQEALLLHLGLNGTRPDGGAAELRVHCGETCLYAAPLTGAGLPGDLLLRLPASALDGAGELPLVLELPPDLGLGFAQLLDPELCNPLYILPNPQDWSFGLLPQEIDLGLATQRALLAPGLHASAAWGAGSHAPQLALFLPILPGAPAQRLTLSLRPVASPEHPSGARVSCNGRLLAEPRWQSSTPVELELTLQEADLQAAPAVLLIEPLSSATPADLELGQERGLAGLGLFDLSLTPEG
ncbi:glycosyltransferase [Salipiger mangrovisoli]|uniref:Glycosyltransferase n=1 Tax=Salipiger mangrovisoli TaxID=2865933 RepID=A0ABR9X9D8_9RHOB|nr:glycosyltransferase [Salipiger mangrovisoli]MBE9640230.1 glycosyltransferase [Salipiger mangrovisoli]